jgi:hypothetical protein
MKHYTLSLDPSLVLITPSWVVRDAHVQRRNQVSFETIGLIASHRNSSMGPTENYEY